MAGAGLTVRKLCFRRPGSTAGIVAGHFTPDVPGDYEVDGGKTFRAIQLLGADGQSGPTLFSDTFRQSSLADSDGLRGAWLVAPKGNPGGGACEVVHRPADHGRLAIKGGLGCGVVSNGAVAKLPSMFTRPLSLVVSDVTLDPSTQLRIALWVFSERKFPVFAAPNARRR